MLGVHVCVCVIQGQRLVRVSWSRTAFPMVLCSSQEEHTEHRTTNTEHTRSQCGIFLVLVLVGKTNDSILVLAFYFVFFFSIPVFSLLFYFEMYSCLLFYFVHFIFVSFITKKRIDK